MGGGCGITASLSWGPSLELKGPERQFVFQVVVANKLTLQSYVVVIL